MEGKKLDEVQEDSKKMKSVLDKLKNTPEMVDSLKTIFKGTELILCQNHLNLCLNPIIDR